MCVINGYTHIHLSNIDCLKAHTTCLVCFISTVNGHHNKRKRSASSGHITNLKQSVLETFNIVSVKLSLYTLLSDSTEVEHLTHNPKIEGLNPATCTFIKKIAKS